ncbi:MAG: hypothetical protein HY907_10750 [Deltaproteobacteria bacterium]|nr:hypothetical protein [Deltaproteobacteria bacterium]
MDERRFERFDAGGAIRFIADGGVGEGDGGGRWTGRVRNLSANGVLVECRGRVPERGAVFWGRLAHRRRMTRRSLVRLLRVLPWSSRDGAHELALRFEGRDGEALADVAELVAAVAPSPPTLAQVLALPQAHGEELIALDTGAFARIVLRGAGRRFRVMSSGRPGGVGCLLVRAGRGEGEPLRAFPVSGVSASWAPAGEPVMLVAGGRRSLVILRAGLAGGGPPWEVCPLGAWLFRRRSGDRIRLSSERPLIVRLEHPLVPGRTVVRAVRDIGEGGLSFDGDVRADALSPGTAFPTMRLTLPEGDQVVLAGSIRSARPVPAGGHRFGMRIDASMPPGAWDAAVLRALHPHVRPLGPLDPPRVWELLDRTGYLDEKPRECTEPLGESFRSAWGRLAAVPRVGGSLLLHDEAALRGAVFQTQAYPGTFILHQLALDLRSPERDVPRPVIAGQIYRSLFHLCSRAPGLRHTLAIFNDEKAWSGYLYDEFFALAGDRARYSVERLRLVEKVRAKDAEGGTSGASGAGDARAAASGIEVRPFVAADAAAIEGAVRRDMPELAAEALALAPLDAELRGLDEEYRVAGLRRSREVLVAWRGGRAVGAVAADRASPGINIFGLLDAVLPVALESPAGPFDWLHALLAEVERRRAEAGGAVLALVPAGWPPEAVPAGYREVAVVRRWIAHRSLLPAYLAYLDEHFGIGNEAEGDEP